MKVQMFLSLNRYGHILDCSNLPFQEEELPVDRYWGHVSHITDGAGRPKFDVRSGYVYDQSPVLTTHKCRHRKGFSAVNLIKTKTHNRLKTEGSKASASNDSRKFLPSQRFLIRMQASNLFGDKNELDASSDDD